MAGVFSFRPGRSIKDVNPQSVGTELERLRRQHGTLTPDAVVEAARADDSPLHAAFTWDDTAAAHQHRLTEARRLIVSIQVLDSPAARPVTAFVSVRDPEKGRSYVPTVEALSDAEMRARVLAEARQMVEALERRWSQFAGVADILARIRGAAVA